MEMPIHPMASAPAKTHRMCRWGRTLLIIDGILRCRVGKSTRQATCVDARMRKATPRRDRASGRNRLRVGVLLPGFEVARQRFDCDGIVRAAPVKLGAHPGFGLAVPLFTISAEARADIHSLPGFDVSPDGNCFVIPVVSDASGPSIVIIQNWEGLLAASPTASSESR